MFVVVFVSMFYVMCICICRSVFAVAVQLKLLLHEWSEWFLSNLTAAAINLDAKPICIEKWQNSLPFMASPSSSPLLRCNTAFVNNTHGTELCSGIERIHKSLTSFSNDDFFPHQIKKILPGAHEIHCVY